KGISSIQYNYLNLPGKITQNAKVTDYTYRADGVKVKKLFGTVTTDYLDGFQYEDGTLKFFPTAEGYYNAETGKYVYNYTDHLGNTRLSYFKNGAGAEIIEESNYYPFGLKHEGYNVLGGNPAYKYKYNGKELQETGMYDYGARFYMADLGRWGVIDPLAEQYRRHSTYNYAVNNPIRFIDPDGRGVNDVVITGDLKDKAFKQLQSKTTNLDLKIDKNGKVTGSVKEGATATKAEQKLLEATNDHSVIVNLEATSANQTADGNYIVSGSYGGNKVVEGENGETITEGYQILNPNQAEKVDKAEKSPQGSAALHEILESYISASETPGSSKGNIPNYLNAHNKASALDPDRIRNGTPGKDIKKNRDGSITEKIYLDINGKKYPLYENKIPN
ncbi:RHS repeat-associated core domain-containing protein, partial [Chryseobacterium kwangjuense]|uniref:RHS repeat-associated core domain-containing protein n=1 Tax=Chryseobacterium kwangjuense TaxID=267125 RepID=UPI000A8D225B